MLSTFIILVVVKYQKNKNSYTTEINILKAKHENFILQTQIEIQEQTFQNISRDIHDNIGQKLSLAKLYLTKYSDTNSGQNNAASDIIGNAIADLRNLSRTLSSDIVIADGIIKAVETEIQLMQKSSIFRTALHVSGEAVFLDDSKDLILFRIIQEALQNIVKHAQASEISIEFNFFLEKLNISIKDNGQGLSEKFIYGQGLKNMEARTKLLCGDFEIKNNSPVGVEIALNIPLK